MKKNSIHDERELLTAIARGDAAAFGRIYEHYRRKVYFIAWRTLQNEDEAEDIQQEIFTKIWLHRAEMATIVHFNSYLNTVVRNQVYNTLRKKAIETNYLHETLPLSNSNPNEAFIRAETKEMHALLHEAINSLSVQQQKVFQLIRMEGRPHAEVAQLLGISRETVKKHIMQAQENITSYFKGRGNLVLLLLLFTLH